MGVGRELKAEESNYLGINSSAVPLVGGTIHRLGQACH